MQSQQHEVYIRSSIARLYIVLGILCMLIFILGAIILADYMNIAYCAASSFLVVIGVKALNSPYAIFDEKQVILFNFLGKERIKYTFSSKKDVKVKNNLLYLDSKKMKINHWFLKAEEWKRLVLFYTEENDDLIFHELQED